MREVGIAARAGHIAQLTPNCVNVTVRVGSRDHEFGGVFNGWRCRRRLCWLYLTSVLRVIESSLRLLHLHFVELVRLFTLLVLLAVGVFFVSLSAGAAYLANLAVERHLGFGGVLCLLSWSPVFESLLIESKPRPFVVGVVVGHRVGVVEIRRPVSIGILKIGGVRLRRPHVVDVGVVRVGWMVDRCWHVHHALSISSRDDV